MRYRVHTWQAARVTYEVDARSAEEAQAMVSTEGFLMTPVGYDTSDPEWSPIYIVDPILDGDGEVDYEHVQHFDESSDDFKEYVDVP